MAEDLLRNAENFNIAFGNVVHMNYASDSKESNEYNMTIQRDNISILVIFIIMSLVLRYLISYFCFLPFLRDQSLLFILVVVYCAWFLRIAFVQEVSMCVCVCVCVWMCVCPPPRL